MQHILGSQASDVVKDICKGLTNAIFRVLSGSQPESKTTESCESLLQVMMKIGDALLTVESLKFALNSCSDSLIPVASFSEKVLIIGRSCGWNVLKPPLEASFRKLSAPGSKFIDYCKFLKRICGSQPSDAQKDVCRGLAGVVVTVLSTEADVHDSFRGKKFLFLLFQLLLSLEDSETLLSLIQAIITKSKRYPLFDTLIPLCEKYYSRGKDSLQLLFTHCITCLESSRAFPCSYDWSQPVAFSCSCNDCALVVQFLKNSTEVTQNYRMALNRYKHIEHQLKERKCSVACATVRGKSPHTLVVTKTMTAGQKAAQCDKLKKASLSHLQALAEPTGKQPESSTGSGPEAGVVLGPSSNGEKRQNPSSATNGQV